MRVCTSYVYMYVNRVHCIHMTMMAVHCIQSLNCCLSPGFVFFCCIVVVLNDNVTWIYYTALPTISLLHYNYLKVYVTKGERGRERE